MIDLFRVGRGSRSRGACESRGPSPFGFGLCHTEVAAERATMPFTSAKPRSRSVFTGAPSRLARSISGHASRAISSGSISPTSAYSAGATCT